MGASDGLTPNLADSVSVIIGGNQGIGASVAQRFAQLGSSVVVVGRNVETLRETADAISRDGGAISWFQFDLANVGSLEDLATQIGSEIGHPSVLVNAAGNSLKKPALEVTVDDWSHVIDTHLRGTFFACQAFGRQMTDAGYGKIVNLSSTWSATVAPERAIYATAKAGVSHMTAALAVEWAPFGVRVNAVAPTATLTPRVAQRHRSDPSTAQYSLDRIPLGRLAEPSDVVEAIVYLSTSASDFVTGHTLFVDGGWRFSK